MSNTHGAGDAAARLRGIGLFCAAMLLFTCLDTAAKYASAWLPALEIAWVRFVAHAFFAFIVMRPWRDWSLYRTHRPVAQVLRAGFLFASTVLNFMAIRTLRLDQTMTIMFASSFAVAALAGPLLGEWVGPRRWAAIVVGFVGVLVVIRPGTDEFSPAMLYSVGAMLGYAAYILSTRALAGTDSAASMLLFPAIIPTFLLAPIALPTAEWPPDIVVGLVVVSTGMFGALGHWCLIHAHRFASTSVLSPFLYTQLLWMTLAGYLFFGQMPDRYTLIGAAIVIASGLYILYRQQVHGDR